jgi:glycosyltransferase involved in cell wall biosynthesis
MKPNCIPVSVVVPVKNEEKNLLRCLPRLQNFGEVIVVDSSSTDNTRDVARRHGAIVVEFKWNGHYPKKRNWVLLEHLPRFDWVLFLDADETVNEEFCSAVSEAVRTTTHDGFWLRYTKYFLGRPLRHGVAQRKLALFRVGKGLYEKIDENSWSGLDMEIHEHPIINGSTGEIRQQIDHNDDRGVIKFIDRHREYALWEARRWTALRENSQQLDFLTPRQKFKYSYISKPWYPFFYFFVDYVLNFGFLDGYAGLQFSLFKFWYFSTIRLLCKYGVT